MRSLLLAALLALPALAYGAPVLRCYPLAVVQGGLATKYGEHVVALGTLGNGALALLSNERTQTYTMMLVRPDRTACPIAAGEHWHRVKSAPGGQGA